MAERIVRVKAQLRRYLYLNAAQGPTVLEHRDLKLDQNTYEARVGERRVTLTAKEFEILKLFLSHPGRVFTKAQIFESVWGEAFTADENTVMVHIRRLRTKIEPDPSNPTYIRIVWGIGYRLGGTINHLLTYPYPRRQWYVGKLLIVVSIVALILGIQFLLQWGAGALYTGASWIRRAKS